MIFVILNLTDNVVPITRTNMEKINIMPHKHYVLNTAHRPEINFWNNCTDPRLKVLKDATVIDRYLRVIKNQENNNTAKVVKTPDEKNQNAVTKVDKDVAVKVTNEVKVEEAKVEATENTTENTTKKYTDIELASMKVVELKALLNKMGIAFESNVNKAGLIELVLNNQ